MARVTVAPKSPSSFYGSCVRLLTPLGPLIPREASKRVPIFDRGTGSKPERLRSNSLQASRAAPQGEPRLRRIRTSEIAVTRCPLFLTRCSGLDSDRPASQAGEVQSVGNREPAVFLTFQSPKNSTKKIKLKRIVFGRTCPSLIYLVLNNLDMGTSQ